MSKFLSRLLIYCTIMVFIFVMVVPIGNSLGEVERKNLYFSNQSSSSFTNNFANLTGHGGPVWFIAFSPDDSTLASSSDDGSIRLWNTSSGEIIHILEGHYWSVDSAQFSNDGSILVSNGDSKINFWNVSTGELMNTWHDSVAGWRFDISPTEDEYIAYPNYLSIIIRNITDGTIERNITSTEAINSVFYSPNGSFIASNHWDLNDFTLWNVSDGTIINTFSGHSEPITDVAFSPDNSLLTSTSFDKTIKIWNTSDGTLIKTLSGHDHPVFTVAFSPVDPALIVSGEGMDTGWPILMHDPSIIFWNLTDGTILEELKGHTNRINDLEFSHDGTILASTGVDRTIKLWGNKPPITLQFSRDYWDTLDAEEGGLNVTLLEDDLLLYTRTHSFLIFREGKMLYEKYYDDIDFQHSKEAIHPVFSVTKSFTSTLIGIAIDKGFITSIDQKVLDFFPDMTFQNVDSWKQAMDIENLLTMTSGMDWSDDNDFGELSQVEDTVQYILDLPMVFEAGTRYSYNSGASHLLSAIIQRTTGMDTFDFAMKYLFEPLDIKRSDITWRADIDGRVHGGSNLFLASQDMAKLGQLYLNEGVWEGEQIISKEWIENATKNYIKDLPRESNP
ncbi:MAG: serine hydrolase, partial [Candidatus Kariarchaeaceae archaeon]